MSKKDEKNITIEYEYDLLNRLTKVDFPNDTDIEYNYDEQGSTNGKGHITSMTDASGSMTFDYDARGRLIQKTSVINSQNYIYEQAFSPGNRLTSVTYPSGRTVDYTRDSMGRVSGLSTTYDTNTIQLISNMTYNPFGSPKALTTGSGGEVENQSGECDCLEASNPGETLERVFTYDDNRNLLSITAANASWYDQEFDYDALNRLTGGDGRYGSIGYTYDDVGNRLTRTINGQTENYYYFTGTNLIDEITNLNPISFSYDDNGNTTGYGSKTLTYNENNRLIEVEEDSSCSKSR